MIKEEKLRLMKKFRIKSIGGGIYGLGFLEGLKASEDYTSRPRPKTEDIEIPKTPN